MSDPGLITTPANTAATTTTTGVAQQWLGFAIEYGARAGLLFVTLLIGWLASRFLRRATTSLVDRLGIEVLAEKLGASRLLYKLGIREGFAKLSGRLSYYFGLFLTFYIALGQLGLPGLTAGLAKAAAFMPTVIASAALALGGFWLADKLKALIAPPNAALTMTRKFASQMAYWGCATLTVTISLEQLGVQVSLIHGIIEVIYGAVVASAAIVFGLSARATMSQLINGHYARKLLRVGDTIAIGEHTGDIARFERLHVAVAVDASKELLLPYDELMSSNFKVEFAS